jgi:hypothetical protein
MGARHPRIHSRTPLRRPHTPGQAADDFRKISDSTLSYREAGSFVAFLITRFGIDRVVPLFSTSTRDDALGTIRMRFEQAFGTTLEDAEADRLAFVG